MCKCNIKGGSMSKNKDTKKEILFVTGNPEKIVIANSVLNAKNIKVKQVKLDCPEIQSDDNEKIARESAKYASNIMQSDIVKVDTGFYIEALNGFPGPYAEYVERKLDAQDIINMMHNKTNRLAYYKEVLAYCKYGGEPILFTAYTYGEISKGLSGNKGYNFDRIFICNNDDETMANYDIAERSEKYNHGNWESLLEYLEQTGELR